MKSILLALSLTFCGQDPVFPPPVTLQELEKEIGEGIPDQQVTLDQCLAVAMENQPRIQAAMASLRAAEAARKGIYSLRGIARLSPDLKIRQSQSDHGLEVARAVLQQETEDTRYAVRRAYMTAIYAGIQADRLTKLVKALEMAREDKGIVGIVVEEFAGVGTRLRMAKAKARNNQAVAQVGRLKARFLLLEEMGGKEAIGFLPDPADTILPKPVVKISLDEFERLMEENRGELRLAREGREIAALELEAQRRALPFRLINNSFASFAGNSAPPVPTPERGGEYRPGAINLEMPPNFGGPKRDRVGRAAALADRATLTENTTRNLTKLESRVTYLNHRETERRIQADKAAISEARLIFNRVTRKPMSFLDGLLLGDSVALLVEYEELRLKRALIAIEMMRETCGALEIPFVQPSADEADTTIGG
jgi:outer membrane protein TolC